MVGNALHLSLYVLNEEKRNEWMSECYVMSDVTRRSYQGKRQVSRPCLLSVPILFCLFRIYTFILRGFLILNGREKDINLQCH